MYLSDQQRYGICVEPGPSDNYIIIGTVNTNNLTGVINDQGTGKNKVIKNNIP